MTDSSVGGKARPKREISSLDLRLLVKEWEFLAGAFIRKVYHSGGEGERQRKAGEWKVVFEVFIPQRGTNFLTVMPSWISLEKAKGFIAETKPSGFCMFLRKNLAGRRIESVVQHSFDRILEISAGGLKLVLEFVPPGNVILLDSEGKILSALRTKKWRDREIRVRSLYQHPPERPDPFSMGFEDFRKSLSQEKKVVVVLASDLGLGSAYANRLCAEAGVRPDKNARALTDEEAKRIFEKLRVLERIPGRPAEKPPEETQEQERLERIEVQRKEALEKWTAAEKLARERADAIYRKFDTVQALLGKFSKKSEIGFEPIVKREGLHITVKLDDADVPLDLKKSAQENAAFYYEQSKKAKRKIAGLKASMGRPLEMKAEERPAEYPDEGRHKDWYQKFKWFLSSDGILVVAGKNAEQNELILKSYAEPEEWCFHADIRGAAFTVIKSSSREPPEQAKKEAAEFAAACSKAWTKGHGAVGVFSVQRKSLSKTPPTGMHLPKGSFMVSGKRVWYRNIPLRMCIGANSEGKIFSGPESAITRASDYRVVLVPGGKKAPDLARDIKSEFLRMVKQKDLHIIQRLSLDEIARHVPFGSGEIGK